MSLMGSIITFIDVRFRSAYCCNFSWSYGLLADAGESQVCFTRLGLIGFQCGDTCIVELCNCLTKRGMIMFLGHTRFQEKPCPSNHCLLRRDVHPARDQKTGPGFFWPWQPTMIIYAICEGTRHTKGYMCTLCCLEN